MRAGFKNWFAKFFQRGFFCLIILLPALAFAHEPSKSYLHLTLEEGHFTGQWDIPIRDLQMVVKLDPHKQGFVSWEELKEKYVSIIGYAFSHLRVELDGRVALLAATTNEPTIAEFSDGDYLQVPFTIAVSGGANSITNAQITYQLFFETNSLHRGLLLLEAHGKKQQAVFSPDTVSQSFQLGMPSPIKQFLSFLKEGVWHIWTGYDHILFLIALLLPAVLHRVKNRWEAVLEFRPTFFNVLKIVTAFTLAHSLTLSLATFEILKIPSRITESAIAASVVLAALNNLFPLVRERSWVVAFAFGLIHGFGFATALADLGLATGSLWLTLTSFNLGVELGQLAIVTAFLPISFALRKSWFYQVPVLRVGSVVIVAIAGLWLAERVGDFKALPF